MPKLLKGIRKQEKKHVNTSLHQKFQSRVYLDRPRCGQSFLLPNVLQNKTTIVVFSMIFGLFFYTKMAILGHQQIPVML